MASVADSRTNSRISPNPISASQTLINGWKQRARKLLRGRAAPISASLCSSRMEASGNGASLDTCA